MPLDYRRDDVRNVVCLKATEPFSFSDVAGMLDRQLADGVWHFGVLVDARQAILSMSDGKTLLEYVRRLATLHGPPGPVALVTRSGVGPAQGYAIRSQQVGFCFEVFWDADEAERWLASRLLTNVSDKHN